MKKLLIGLLLVSLLLGTVACASSSSETARPAATTTATYYQGGVVPATKAAPTAVPPKPTITVTNGPSETSWEGVRMVVRSSNLSLVVVDVAKTIQDITALASGANGFVVTSNTWKADEQIQGNISIRVPAAGFDAAMQQIRAMAVEVSSESTTGEDVTEEYVDLSSKLRNLQAAEEQLLALMQKSGTVADILAVQNQLTATRAEIEQTKGRMQYLEQSVAMSLITVSLSQSKLSVQLTADSRDVRQGDEVWFSAKVAGGFTPYSYAWDFGDGSTSNDEAPTHVYKAKGTYTISLKVTDDRGNTASQERAKYVTVLAAWDISRVASSAWNGFLAFGRVILNIIIWVLVFIPLWVVIGVILYFAWWRRRKKKA